MAIRRYLIALLLALFPLLAAADVVPVPPLTARVTDTTGMLTDSQRAELESRLAAFEARKGAQIAVLIVPSTGDETIEQYSIRVAEAWKIGRSAVDDGAILLIARDDRKLRIEVGYGLEGALPDVTAKRIIRDIITPPFRAGDYNAGISAGIDAMIAVVDGEALPEPAAQRGASSSAGSELPPLGVLAIVVGVLVGFAVRAATNRVAGGGSALLVSGLVGIALVGVAAALFYAFVAFVIVISGGGGRRGRRNSLLDGMMIGGLGGGRGGFGGGGFGGGGGGFGGGGASGDW